MPLVVSMKVFPEKTSKEKKAFGDAESPIPQPSGTNWMKGQRR